MDYLTLRNLVYKAEDKYDRKHPEVRKKKPHRRKGRKRHKEKGQEEEGGAQG